MKDISHLLLLLLHTYITLHYITLHCITLHYITLHYITLHYIHTCIHTYIHNDNDNTNHTIEETTPCKQHEKDMGGIFWCTQLRHIQQGLFIYVLLMTGVLLDRAATLGPGTVAGFCLVVNARWYSGGTPASTFLVVQPVHLHQHASAARRRKSANMVSVLPSYRRFGQYKILYLNIIRSLSLPFSLSLYIYIHTHYIYTIYTYNPFSRGTAASGASCSGRCSPSRTSATTWTTRSRPDVYNFCIVLVISSVLLYHYLCITRTGPTSITSIVTTSVLA